MVNALVALQAKGPDFANEFSKGADAAQGRQMNALRMQGAKEEMGRKQAEWLMQTLGSAGMAALGGDINGQPDPERWEQALDYLDSLGMGLDTQKYRGKAHLAPALVNSALSTWQHVQRAATDREFELSLREFDHKLMEADRRYALDMQKAMGEGSSPTTHGTPIFFEDEEGNTRVGLLPKAGDSLVAIDTPGRILNPYDTSRMRAEGAETGKAVVARREALPKVEGQAKNMLDTLDRLEKHPGFETAVGWQGNIPDRVIPAGTQTAGFISLLNQIQGQAFLQAFETLKGGGQITEIEGKKATDAITRLSRNLSEEEFKDAIGEIREVISTGLERARKGITVNGGGPQSNVEDPLGIR